MCRRRRGLTLVMDKCILCIAATALMILAACSTPPTNQVRSGSDPFHEDDSVAFRTTYYFRVFDYCVVRRVADGGKVLVPRIDSLYRFRMTGKGSTLLQNVKFESGTLRAHEVDPFGARIIRDPNTGQLRFQSQQETDELNKREAALAEFDRLRKYYETLWKKSKEPENSIPQSTLDLLKEAMEDALRDFSSTSGPAPARPPVYAVIDVNRTSDESTEQTTITFNLEMLSPYRAIYPVSTTFDKEGKVSEFEILAGVPLFDGQGKLPHLRLRKNSTTTVDAEGITSLVIHFEDKYEAETSMRVAPALTADVRATATGTDMFVSLGRTKMLTSGSYAGSADASASHLTNLARPTEIKCSEGAPHRRGFQILGPEGWRTFNQDERLVMAMTTDAQPLISTLKDISGRILKASSSEEAVLLPISEARRKLLQAERVLHQLSLAENTTPEVVSEQVSDELTKK